jgi:Rps23 Pro-64 3,4-dihydroxylase Tpa1-like proline 4-hydroxylase
MQSSDATIEIQDNPAVSDSVLEYSPVNLDALREGFAHFHHAHPFDHCVIDGFLKEEAMHRLSSEFIPYDSNKWFVYQNAIEDKRTLNDWNIFPKETYQFFSYLNSAAFLDILSELAGIRLFADGGLHGGGWHSHRQGGYLNPHLDYSIHPKLKLQRKLNIILYASPSMRNEYGGHLGLWTHNPATNQPGELIKEVAPAFNRAIIFDTTQNSWHGMSRALTQPEGIYRQSLAIYYLCVPGAQASKHERALFAPTQAQIGDKDVEELIRQRAGVESSVKVYRKPS